MRVPGFSKYHEDETTVSLHSAYFLSVTDLGLTYMQSQSLGNKMLDTNKSGLLALTLSRGGGDPGRRCMLCV